MSHKGSIVLVLVLALCAAGAASALPLDPELAEAPGGGGLLGGWWDRFLDWLEKAGGKEDLSIRETEGCHLDPNGSCSATG